MYRLEILSLVAWGRRSDDVSILVLWRLEFRTASVCTFAVTNADLKTQLHLLWIFLMCNFYSELPADIYYVRIIGRGLKAKVSYSFAGTHPWSGHLYVSDMTIQFYMSAGRGVCCRQHLFENQAFSLHVTPPPSDKNPDL